MTTLIFIAVGALLVVMAVAGSVLKRLPLTTSIVYLGFGMVVGPMGLGLVKLDALSDAGPLERLTEIAVIISLFSAGLKLRTSLSDASWRATWRLASVSMLITIGLIALVGVLWLKLPLGAAVLLGAVLAPTDPVLASEVQVEHPNDRDRLRFGLTGEAGLNDGAAFPFVMLGLGLLGLHEIGAGGVRWVMVDLAWATVGGLTIGGVLGWMIASLVLHLRSEYSEALGLDDFLAMGLIALSYGLALLAHAYGFLAVFAAGLALRRVEMGATGPAPPQEVLSASHVGEADEIAADPKKGPAFMAQAVLGFNEQLERLVGAAMVTLVGTLLTPALLRPEAIGFAALLLFVIRPLAVQVGLLGSSMTSMQRGLMSWFGIRGIGSLYYLMYAVQHGVPRPIAELMVQLTLVIVTFSVLAHGLSVTPLMSRYAAHRESRAPRPRQPA
ncbi:MAG: cation:proton antiporter [Actinomycetota bacterium]